MKIDTGEKALESLIMRHMAGRDGLASSAAGVVAEAAPDTTGSGLLAGSPTAYNRKFAVDARPSFTVFIARSNPDISLMQEYRTRLTADLVTGKRDVREAASNLPALSADTTADPVADEALEEIETEEIEA